MTSPDCPELDVLERLIDGELPVDVESRLAEHVSHCAGCQAILDRKSTECELPNRMGDLTIDQEKSPHLVAALREVKALRGARDSSASDGSDALDAIDWEAAGYEPLEIVGRGGMGVVIKARDPKLDRFVAVKTLSPLLANDKSARERFLREARAAAALKHPHVVTIYAVADDERMPYLVMEYVEGGSLHDALERAPLPLETTLRIAAEVASGLAAAHAAGIVHRDVKPSNILLEGSEQRVKLGDFGLAQLAGNSALTRTGMIMGTPEFLAPELLEESEDCDHRSDLFSLGGVFYFMCCGVSPFAAKTLPAVLHRVAEAKPAPIHEHAPSLPSGLSAIIHRLLAKSPDERFQFADEVVAALAEELTWTPPEPPIVQPSQAPPPKAVSLPSNRPKRRSGFPTWVGFVAIAAVVTTMLAALIVLSGRAPEGRNEERVASQTGDPEKDQEFDETAPFVLVDSDRNAASYPSLEEAVEDARAGDRLELRDDGPFIINETLHLPADIKVVAGPGFHPVIRFEPETPLEEWAAVIVSEGLTLEGLQLEVDADGDEDDITFLHLESGTFLARGCRFFARGSGRCLSSEGASRIEFRDCDLLSAETPAMEINLMDHAEIVLSNCLVVGRVGIQLETDAAADLTIEQSTFATDRAIEIFPSSEPSDGLSVTVTQSLFKSRECLTLLELDSTAEAQSRFARFLRWEGLGNVYSGPFVLLDEFEDPPSWGRDLDGWRTVSDERDSRAMSEPFGGRGDALMDQAFAGDTFDTSLFENRDLENSGKPIGVRRK